ncbi:MAG: RHS repeat-associated core domain-containing protein [Ruminococcaceae bacterium]|nr:RHS repeat-associated core domain-containing protein [Oscillospiraceae bacterium]
MSYPVYFKYNDEGIRTYKEQDGIDHEYILDGSRIIGEWIYNRTILILYIYDEVGSPIGMKMRTASQTKGVFDEYFFEKNLQGDIVAVYNSEGEKIGTYTYDAWGNCTVTTTSTNIAAESNVVRTYNPFRYRGYYYDVETGLYYLQSRYYNPAWGRFINADGAINANGDLIGYNLFAYCSNSPVVHKDDSGYIIDTIFDVVSLGFSIYDVCTNPDDPWAWVGLAADVACLVIPFATGGGLAVDALSKADDVVDFCRAADTVDDIADATRAGANVVDAFSDAGKGFDSYKQLKNYIGSPGEGNEWHHIVEQCQVSKSGFSSQMIQNTNNIVAIDKNTHRAISGYYSSIQIFTEGKSVRNWLAGQSFSFQYQFGLDVLDALK